LTILCTECGRELKIPEQYLGQWGTCKHCGKQIQVLVSPQTFSKNTYEVDGDIDQEDTLPSSAEHNKWKSLQQIESNPAVSFDFDEGHGQENRRKPLGTPARKIELADMFGKIGKSFVGCGCLLLISPVILFIILVTYRKYSIIKNKKSHAAISISC